jgi:hypothetical protein
MTAEPDPPMDPIEALKHIRALVEGSCEATYGTKAEPMIRMISAILDKALPPKERPRPAKP